MKMDNNPDKKNIWMYSTFVLGITAIILLVLVFRGGISGSIVSEETAEENVINFLKSQGRDATISSISEENGFYKVLVSMDGQEIPAYVTRDGKYLTTGLIPLTELVMGNNAVNTNTNTNTNTNSPAANVQKSDKPVVEAFIFSYCPYGLQFEKAMFPVYDLLKDKVDFKIVAIGAMHGEYEKIETLRQISIEGLYSKDKLFLYLKEFDVNTNIGACRGDENCLDKYLPNIYKKLGIDKTKVENYMKSDAGKIYDEQNARANSLGIGGSPTFVINGVEAQVSRNPESIKQAVCDAFNTAPSECSQTLSTTGASAGFG